MRNKSAVKPIIVGLYMIRLSRILTLISNIMSDSSFICLSIRIGNHKQRPDECQ